MQSSPKSVSKGRRSIAAVAGAAAPLLIIGSLIYAAFFVKAEVRVDAIKTPAIERRDAFYGLAIPKSGVIWAVGSYGKIVRSVDAGAAWTIQSSPIDVHLQSIAAWDEQRAVAVGNQGRVIVTSDGGANWKEVEVPRSDVANKLIKVRAYADGGAWAVGELGAVLKSTDFGATWVRALPEKDQAWNDIFFVGNDGWLVGEFGHVMRSRDGGKNWEKSSSPGGPSLMSVFFRDAGHGAAVGLSGTVLTTQDGGESWQAVPPVTREHLNHVGWDGKQWQAVGDKGMRVVGDGSVWKGARLSEQDLSWRTQAETMDGQLVLAGANLATLDQKQLRIFGRPQ
ncbi:YCF48-related protein [Methylibium sp.]|uniref:YCF48-related protein n=1 Tax=Methylibium sp. TaxID=2067992 RepID=UPI003D0B00B4